MWMWNLTCFAILRFPIVYFPLKTNLFSKVFTWKLNLLEVLIALVIWSFIIFFYSYNCYGSTPSLCFCYSTLVLYPWVSTIYTILYRYIIYVFPLIIIIITQIILIIKIASAIKQRKSLVRNPNVSKNDKNNNRLNIICNFNIINIYNYNCATSCSCNVI